VRIAPGTRVERRADWRRRQRFAAKHLQPERLRAGTVAAVGSDMFSKRYALVSWDEGGQQYCNNADLRIVRGAER